MNYKKLGKILGKIMILESILMLAPLAVAVIYKHGFFSNFSAVLTCISNVGPAFEAVGPYASFAEYSGFSKIVLTLTMMIGRLEILPVFILFNPSTWKKV